ncbi:MAG: ATP synthase F0 subunit B [Pyrinomonadaceae bacterium]|nr:ATP synthase F0 subunit B [Pyrinomonadaceae bacterium]
MCPFAFATLMLETDGVWRTYLNYPGLELWKFVNLAVFVVGAVYLHRRFGRPISEALRARGEGIKHELARARAEKEQALAKLAEVEAKIQLMDSEASSIREQAKIEAEAERERIKVATESEMTKLKQQAQREIESSAKAAVQELREFAAQQSVALAEVSIKRDLRVEDDRRIIGLNVEQLGRDGH